MSARSNIRAAAAAAVLQIARNDDFGAALLVKPPAGDPFTVRCIASRENARRDPQSAGIVRLSERKITVPYQVGFTRSEINVSCVVSLDDGDTWQIVGAVEWDGAGAIATLTITTREHLT